MSFRLLALVCLAGLVGPILAVSRRWGVPVVVGELLAGIGLGPIGAGALHPADATFSFLATIGFALVMFVAGSHIPIRDRSLRRALPVGTARMLLVGAVAVPVAWAVARAFDTGHVALYAVLLASSSAALVLPIVDGLGLHGPAVLQLLPQVAVADAACIVALPLALDPARAGRAAIGAVLLVACSAALYLVLREADRRGWRKKLHHFSERRKFALELRINLAALFALAAVAQAGQVSIMLAGFSFGLVVAAIGEPRRLARQFFAVTEGFFGPLFFIWLGSSLELSSLAARPALIGLGLALGLGAVAVHLVASLVGQPVSLAALAAAQLGVPVAAATLGTQSHLLSTGVPAALILGALVTIGVASVAATVTARPTGQLAVG